MVSSPPGLWYSGGVKMFPLITCALLMTSAGMACAEQQGPDALSRIFRHRDGKRTETQKMGGSNKIREAVFDKNQILCAEREFTLNSNGQILNSIILDGKKNPVASTINTFEPQTGRLLFETMYDSKGRPIRKLYYPGVLSEPQFAKRMVAFSFNPENPKAAPKQIGGEVKPITMVTKEEDEFEPGLPQGTAAPTAEEAARNRSAASSAPKAVPKRSWFPQRKTR